MIEQNSVLTGLKRFSVDNKVKYRGKLSAPYVSEPANMIVRFPLSKLIQVTARSRATHQKSGFFARSSWNGEFCHP